MRECDPGPHKEEPARLTETPEEILKEDNSRIPNIM